MSNLGGTLTADTSTFTGNVSLAGAGGVYYRAGTFIDVTPGRITMNTTKTVGDDLFEE